MRRFSGRIGDGCFFLLWRFLRRRLLGSRRGLRRRRRRDLLGRFLDTLLLLHPRQLNGIHIDDANVLPPLRVGKALAILILIDLEPQYRRGSVSLAAFGRLDQFGHEGVGPFEIGTFDEGGIADREGPGFDGGVFAGGGGGEVIGLAFVAELVGGEVDGGSALGGGGGCDGFCDCVGHGWSLLMESIDMECIGVFRSRLS
mmetsp:Transcript_35614/g.65913  ORF Transcript_35614/g.65913 Transcript_35614/m.65913 type:complete len:200 (-) Transcript_35614:146-745(-)